MTNNKTSNKPTLQPSHSSPNTSAFGNSLFLISHSPIQDHLEPSTPTFEVQSPSLYLSKDLLSKLDEQSPCTPILQDKHFTYILNDFIQINNTPIQLPNNKICYHNNNKDKQKNNINVFKKKKYFKERVGDWVCYRCNNLNFSFRTICNRCKIAKSTSQQMQNETKPKK